MIINSIKVSVGLLSASASVKSIVWDIVLIALIAAIVISVIVVCALRKKKGKPCIGCDCCDGRCDCCRGCDKSAPKDE